MTRYSFWLAVAAAVLFALSTGASAAGAPHGKRAAENALKRVKDLKKGIGVRTGRELTPALAQLAARRGALDPAQRKEAAALLARPTDPGDADYYGNTYIGDVETDCPAASIFCFHWVDDPLSPDAPAGADNDPNTVPAYIQQMAGVFDEVYGCENGTAVAACGEGTSAGIGWQQPVSDGAVGGDSNKFDVYIRDEYSDGFYGYAAPECPDPLTTNSCPAYMVMDKDYSRFPPAASGETALDAMSVTAAHEYNHVLQMGYDVLEDLWMFESTAVYMEEKVYPSINDYFQYLPSWVQNTGVPLTAPTFLKIYGSGVWNHWLDHRYGGEDVIQLAWSQSPGLNSFAPAAYDKSIRDRAGAGFADEFEEFAAAVAEWGVPGSGFPDTYPDVPNRPGLTSDAPATTMTLDHTTFAFRNVTPPAAGVPLALTATLPNGLTGAIALVGRTGNSTTAGSVITRIARTTTGGKLTVTLPDPSTFGRITAVLVNADPTTVGPWSAVLQDWRFTKDGQTFSAVGALTRPQVATGSASAGATSATLNGTVNAIGAGTTYWFDYGTSTAYGSQAPLPAADAGSGTADAPVSATATGLVPGTTYHYRLVAHGPGGTTVGSDQTFTTASPPVVTTGAASAIGVDSATLNATVDPRGTPTTYAFEFGTSTVYGKKVPLTPGALGSASQALAVATPVTGLKPGATIHFRVVATNSAGTTTGADASFKTRARRVLASVVKTKVASALKRGVAARVRCNANCSVTAQLLLPAKLAKRLHVKRLVATVKVKTGIGGRAVRLRFAKKVKRRLAKQRSLALSLKLTATTPAGGRASANKSVKLR
jgi:hypothetical protein